MFQTVVAEEALEEQSDRQSVEGVAKETALHVLLREVLGACELFAVTLVCSLGVTRQKTNQHFPLGGAHHAPQVGVQPCAKSCTPRPMPARQVPKVARHSRAVQASLEASGSRGAGAAIALADSAAGCAVDGTLRLQTHTTPASASGWRRRTELRRLWP